MRNKIVDLHEIRAQVSPLFHFENLNFSVKKGEHWALLGGSDSGKTALLQIIHGKLGITKGKITYPVFEKFIAEQQKKDPLFHGHHLTAMVGNRHQFKNLSNTSTFYYQQRFNSAGAEDAETVENYLRAVPPVVPGSWNFENVVRELTLENLLPKQLIKLSNGETKRVRIATALLQNPKILLLEEPFTGLDTFTRKKMSQLLDEIAAQGITLILATASKEIPEAINQVAVMKDTRIVKTGGNELLQKYNPVSEERISLDKNTIRELFPKLSEKKWDTIIEMNDIHIKYGEKTILKGINWTVKPGDRWALTGQNGAGKSTLLSLINGDNPQAYANNIRLFDKKRGSGESIWDIKKKIGFVSHELFQYFPDRGTCLSVVESGYYDTLGLFRKSTPGKSEKAKKWLKLLQIENYAQSRFKKVPASVQRLVLLARALIKNPPLLIFDEPCQGLDPQQKAYFQQIVDEICTYTSTTLIYVCHYQQEIPSCVNKKIVLEAGKRLD